MGLAYCRQCSALILPSYICACHNPFLCNGSSDQLSAAQSGSFGTISCHVPEERTHLTYWEGRISLILSFFRCDLKDRCEGTEMAFIIYSLSSCLPPCSFSRKLSNTFNCSIYLVIPAFRWEAFVVSLKRHTVNSVAWLCFQRMPLLGSWRCWFILFPQTFLSFLYSKPCQWIWAAAASGAVETAGLVSTAVRQLLIRAAQAPPHGPLRTFLKPSQGPANQLWWTRLALQWWPSPSHKPNPSPADIICTPHVSLAAV